MTMRRGLLIILSSPSGAGKSTLAAALRTWDQDIQFSISATTRPPRPGEQDGREYHFVTHDGFKAAIENGEMLEHAEVFGNFYGSPKGPVEKAIDLGTDVLFDVDWQGGQQIRASSLGKSVLSIFILPPSIAALEARLKSRASDSAQVIQKRMSKSQAEISHWNEYDYVLINDDLETTKDRLIKIVASERLRRTHQISLDQHVQALNSEFEGRS